MITIDRWFIKHAFRPITILVVGLYFLFICSILVLYFKHKSDNEIFINQSAKQLLLAINQKNRSQVDVTISTLAKLETVSAVSLCDGGKTIISRRGSANFCSLDNHFILDIPITGSESYFLRVQFKNVFLSFGVILGAIIAALGALAGFLILIQFKKKFEADLLNKIKNIDNLKNVYSIKELNEISNSIFDSQENKVKLQSQKKLTDLSAQVSHDIRSPLSALNYIIASQNNISEGDKIILNKALNRINEIADDLLSENRSVRNEEFEEFEEVLEKVDVVQTISDIIDEKQLELKKYELVFINFTNEINAKTKSFISAKSLCRVVSNLINNSVEAMKYEGVIQVSLYQNKKNLIIEICDQGGGLSNYLLEKIGKEKLTTKSNGNGIGVANSVKVVEGWGGKLQFENFNQGLKVRIILNIDNESSIDAVLVDNDELCRIIWEKKAKSKGLTILTFSSPLAFFKIKNTIKSTTPIYLDSQLEDGVKGEAVASKLFEEGFSALFMTTGYSPEMFADYPFLSGVISKAPPF